VVGDGLEREGRHDVSPRLRRRREDLHEVAHRDLVRRQLQQRPPGAARGRRVPAAAAAAADPREQAHAPPPPGTEGFEIGSPSFFFPARRRSKRRLGGASGEGGLGLWWVGLPFAGFYLLWACCLPSQICGLGVCSLVWAWAFVLKVLNCAGNSDFFFVFEKKKKRKWYFCSLFCVHSS
jgi:hypothetical protein